MKIIRELSEETQNERKQQAEYLQIILPLIDRELQEYVRDRVYTIQRDNTTTVYFTDEVQQKTYTDHKQARFWYRAMPAEEYISLRDTNSIRSASHCGIAPFFDYCENYLTNKNKNNYLVEFRLPMTGQELIDMIRKSYNEDPGIKPKKPHDIKVESGTISIGLGETGFYWGEAGKVFNKLLATRQITWSLVYFKVNLNDEVQKKIRAWKDNQGIS